MSKQFRVLLAGETWMSYGIHIKGFGAYTTGSYEEGLAPLADAVNGWCELVHLPNHLAAHEFPGSLEALQAYDVILLSDIPSDTILLHPDTIFHSKVKPNRLRLIQSYVEAGGGFGMIGGYMSFSGFEGKANYRNTHIAKVLPVVMGAGDDRIESPEGIRPTVTDSSHPILKGIGGEWPVLLGYNRFTAKPEADVVLEYEDDPFLVTGSFGSGRVAAYASDCSPHWGSPDFVNWQYYKTFWRQFIAWLAGET